MVSQESQGKRAQFVVLGNASDYGLAQEGRARGPTRRPPAAASVDPEVGQGDAPLTDPTGPGRPTLEGVRVEPAELGAPRRYRDRPVGHPELEDTDQFVAGGQP